MRGMNLNLCILRMLEDIFLLGVAHIEDRCFVRCLFTVLKDLLMLNRPDAVGRFFSFVQKTQLL